MNIRNIENIEELSILAKTIWHECYKELLSYDQIEYMTNLFLSISAIKKNIQDGYIYQGLFDNDKLVGFTASINEDNRIFLSKLYILKEYRGLGYSNKLIENVLKIHSNRTIYLTVNKYNKSFEIYKHLGFKIIDSVCSDIGNGYVMDDYIMEKTF